MNQQQQAFRNRVMELLRRTERLQEAVKQFAETVEDDQVDYREGAFAPVGAAVGSEEGTASVAVAPVRPEHGDALAPDYVAVEQADVYEDKQPPRERVEAAFDEVQDAADDVSSLVDDIDIDDLLAGIDDSDMQL